MHLKLKKIMYFNNINTEEVDVDHAHADKISTLRESRSTANLIDQQDRAMILLLHHLQPLL